MIRCLLALALSLAISPVLAADAPAVDEAAVKQKVEEAQAAAAAGDLAGAFRLLGAATEMAQSGAMAHKLGHMYERAADVPDHEALATKWFMYGADHEDAESMHHVGMRYIEGTGGLSRDFDKGLDLVYASSRAGYDVARDFIGDWREQQATRSRCMLHALREYKMREVVFGADRFYDFTDTGNDTGGGDTYLIRGLPDNTGIELGAPDAASLSVDGFSHVGYTEVDGVHFYHDYYDKRRPSSAAVQRAAQVRAQCGVADD